MSSRSKIWPLGDLPSVIDRDDRKIVMAVGCWDLLHAGHIRHLEAAKGCGDVLVVAVTCDRYFNKGPGRPVVGEMDRAVTVAGLGCVDYVFIDHEAPPSLDMFRTIRPDLYVKGNDYEDRINPLLSMQIKLVQSLGGDFKLTECPEMHTAELIRKIRAAI